MTNSLKGFCEILFWSRYLYIVYKVKVSLTGFVFKKEAFCMHCFGVAVNHEEKWIVCDSIHISIDYFIYLLEHFICVYSLGTQSSKLLIKSQHIHCINHLTLKECGKGGGVRRVWRYQRGYHNPYMVSKKNREYKEKEQTTIYKTYT
jgi:hypothetical protein